MNIPLRHACRSLAALSTGIMLTLAGSQLSLAAEPGPDQKPDWSQHRQQWVQSRIDKAAERLEIKSSQQSAWQVYAKSIEALTEQPGKPPAKDADAATMAKLAADRAAEFAKKLKQVADATARLQAVLSPEQRKTLDQLAHEAGERMMMMRHHAEGMHDGMHGAHEGMGEMDHCSRPDHEKMHGGMSERPHDAGPPPPPAPNR